MKDLLTWIGSLPPLAQIPIIVGLFLARRRRDRAPHRGRAATRPQVHDHPVWPRASRSPASPSCLLGSVWWAVAIAVVLGGLFFLLDYRSREGSGYLFALVGFLAPALAAHGDRPRLPDHSDDHQLVPQQPRRLRRHRQLRVDLQPEREPGRHPQHHPLGTRRAGLVDRDRSRLRGVHRQVTRREVLQDPRVHADGDLVRRREHHLAVRLRVPPRGARPDRHPERPRHLVRWRTRQLAAGGARSTRSC